MIDLSLDLPQAGRNVSFPAFVVTAGSFVEQTAAASKFRHRAGLYGGFATTLRCRRNGQWMATNLNNRLEE
jgi:hypothetical protein